jgi:hypothetical protein
VVEIISIQKRGRRLSRIFSCAAEAEENPVPFFLYIAMTGGIVEPDIASSSADEDR